MNNFRAIKHIDVRNNELYYLKLSNIKTGKSHLVNIGKKTYEAALALTTEPAAMPELRFEDNKTDGNAPEMDSKKPKR